jgi:streptogramin lyase
VSRRFVLGDRNADRLLIVDEVSRNVVNYVGAAAGFLDQLTAFTIDSRRGDLWVVSAEGEEGASESALHKLQLVSGRSLLEARAPAGAGPVRFVAVAVVPDGTVYALDARGPRVFRLRPGARSLDLVMRLEAGSPTALAAADDGTLYVADATGLIRVDPAARAATRVKTAEDLSGFESLAWRAGTLVGIERVAGSYLVVRLKLDPAGVRAQPRQILAASPTATIGTLAGDGFYYLSSEQTIRRVPLR